MIKNEIAQAQHNLSNLKERYKNLVSDIKKVFYAKEDYWDENSKMKPRNETARMAAAFCLAMDNCPNYSFDLRINQATVWKSNPSEYLDKWYVYSDRFERYGSTSPVIIIKKKNLKILDEICKEMWVKEVSASYRPNTTLGFEEWLEKTSVDKILELIQKHMNNRVDIVTDRNLYIKDIIVIYPHQIRNF